MPKHEGASLDCILQCGARAVVSDSELTGYVVMQLGNEVWALTREDAKRLSQALTHAIALPKGR
jgi:hypothetical protein